jgi:hypothetical protein
VPVAYEGSQRHQQRGDFRIPPALLVVADCPDSGQHVCTWENVIEIHWELHSITRVGDEKEDKAVFFVNDLTDCLF